MNIFLDTSSLFKLYFQESGSAELDQLFERQSIEQIYLSGLAPVEFRSIVWRKVRMNEITAENATLLLNAFDEDYSTYTFIPVDELLLQLSCQLFDKYGQSGFRSLAVFRSYSSLPTTPRRFIHIHFYLLHRISDLFDAGVFDFSHFQHHLHIQTRLPQCLVR